MESTGLARVRGLGIGAAGVALAALPTWMVATASAQDTVRVSVDSTGAQGNGDSFLASICNDGRFVAFWSDASNLVAGDTNRSSDVFVHDALTGATERVSVDSSGAQGDATSANPSISGDGRYVAFVSWSANLVAGDTNGFSDIFVHDRSTGATERVSVDSSGLQADHNCVNPSISADGNVVAFVSDATNLVAGDTNATWDVFVHDRSTGVTERVSVDSKGVEGDSGSYAFPSLSADGQIVAFGSDATKLVAGDTNTATDVFVRDRAAGVTERISVGGSGQEGNDYSFSIFNSLSADGRIVAFYSFAANLVGNDTNEFEDVFVHDRSTGMTERVSVDSSGGQGNGDCAYPSLSSDGLRVAFMSDSSNLVSGDTNGSFDVFVHDRTSGLTERDSVDPSGAQGNGFSGTPAISGDGQSVAFHSLASNLVADDTNDHSDIFVRGTCSTLASWSNYGAGYAGTNGVPTFTSRQNPVLGSTITLDLANSAASSTHGLIFIGFAQTDIPSTWGGALLVVPTVTLFVSIAPGGVVITGTIPNDPELCATAIDLQAVELDRGAAHGVSFTPGLALLFGH